MKGSHLPLPDLLCLLPAVFYIMIVRTRGKGKRNQRNHTHEGMRVMEAKGKKEMNESEQVSGQNVENKDRKAADNRQ